jgi:FtsZ-binding cell division protein ZapB
LNRKLNVAQKAGDIPTLPKGMVKPIIVAGVNALGRGQDRESLGQFLTTISQTMGPEATQKFINPEEVIKRLAAAQGIDTLNLVRSMDELKQEEQDMMQQQQQAEQQKAAMSSPMADPTKNPQLMEQLS